MKDWVVMLFFSFLIGALGLWKISYEARKQYSPVASNYYGTVAFVFFVFSFVVLIKWLSYAN